MDGKLLFEEPTHILCFTLNRARGLATGRANVLHGVFAVRSNRISRTIFPLTTFKYETRVKVHTRGGKII